MVHTLKLEWLNEGEGISPKGYLFYKSLGGKPSRKPWVAKILGRGGRYGYQREFQKFQKDYSEANGVGTRGVYLYFHIKDPGLYEINSYLSWKRTDRYFAYFNGISLIKIKEEDIDKWVKPI